MLGCSVVIRERVPAISPKKLRRQAQYRQAHYRRHRHPEFHLLASRLLAVTGVLVQISYIPILDVCA